MPTHDVSEAVSYRVLGVGNVVGVALVIACSLYSFGETGTCRRPDQLAIYETRVLS